jgi:hypothetical protein
MAGDREHLTDDALAPLVLQLRDNCQDVLVSHPELADWADAATCTRFLRARDGKLPEATKMLRETLMWRVSFGVSALSDEPKAAAIRAASKTGKLRVSPSRDLSGRPVLVMCPRHENDKSNHEGNLLNLVYHLERASGSRALKEGNASSPDGKMVVVMDFKGYSMFNAPPMKTSRATLSILQDHYPERLHKFVLLNAPTLFYVFFKAISPFIDPVTRAKINFIKGSAAEQRQQLECFFDFEALESEVGGALPFQWDPDAYFAQDAGFTAESQHVDAKQAVGH